MGRTYRRNPDDYNQYGKSLREKRQRGGTRSNWENTYDAPKKRRNNKNWDDNEGGYYDQRSYG